MNDWTLDDLNEYGFEGFFKISDLRRDITKIPLERGVYMIINPDKAKKFIEEGTGGYYNGKNPNVTLGILEDNWVYGSNILYIGQAGGIIKGKWSESKLRNRISAYFRFGQGKPVSHQGGRYIWQIADNQSLIVCWKVLPDKIKDPCQEEYELIARFKAFYSKRPFANLNDGSRCK